MTTAPITAVYVAGFKNSAGRQYFVANKAGDVGLEPWPFDDYDEALRLAKALAENYPLWAEVFVLSV